MFLETLHFEGDPPVFQLSNLCPIVSQAYTLIFRLQGKLYIVIY